jgi:hypothetical protein
MTVSATVPLGYDDPWLRLQDVPAQAKEYSVKHHTISDCRLPRPYLLSIHDNLVI